MTTTTLTARLWLGFCSLFVLIPLGVILSSLGEFDAEIWQFLLDYELTKLLTNTLWLVLSVGVGVIALGTSLAWLIAMHDFPGKRFFGWAMMLPLAMPAYVLAFVQLGLFDYTGVISTHLREAWGFEQGLPEIRHGGGLAVVLSLTLYPYVYLLCKNAFNGMGGRALEVGASLGLSPYRAFFKIALPMARPWIASGTILATMEVLADFGAVSIFGYDTFTTAIYQAWYGFFSLDTAKQLASLLVGLVFIVLVIEQMSRGRKRFESTGRTNHHRTIALHGTKKWLAFTYCAVILFLAFVLPIIQLSLWIIDTWQGIDFLAVFEQTKNAIIASLCAALLVTSVAFFISLSTRHAVGKFGMGAAKISTLGYAIPGSVLAVGVFIPVALLDNYLIEHVPVFATHDAIFKGTVIMLLIAYLIRFLALGVQSVDAGMKRIRPSHLEVAKSLGISPFRSLFAVYLPLVKGSLGVSLLMVFVDTMKEMPITLMMRPFDWDTLAIRIYSFTSEGMYEQAALPALIIVLTGLIPVILFTKIDQKN